MMQSIVKSRSGMPTALASAAIAFCTQEGTLQSVAVNCKLADLMCQGYEICMLPLPPQFCLSLSFYLHPHDVLQEGSGHGQRLHLASLLMFCFPLEGSCATQGGH